MMMMMNILDMYVQDWSKNCHIVKDKLVIGADQKISQSVLRPFASHWNRESTAQLRGRSFSRLSTLFASQNGHLITYTFTKTNSVNSLLVKESFIQPGSHLAMMTDRHSVSPTDISPASHISQSFNMSRKDLLSLSLSHSIIRTWFTKPVSHLVCQ
jgi:hypothetical protein